MKVFNRWWAKTRRKQRSSRSSVLAAWVKPFSWNSWAARRASSRRRMNTQRLLAQMARIIEIIMAEGGWASWARAPRGTVCLLFLDNSHPPKMLVQIWGPHLARPPAPVEPHKPPTSALLENRYCQQDQMKWGFRGPPYAACSNKQARCVDLWMRPRGHICRDVGWAC